MKDQPLDSSEFGRLDELLGAARRFHYLAFSTAGTSLALSALDQSAGISLPLGDISLPGTQFAVALYLLVIVATIASDRFLRAARQWIKADPRRPQYAWIALGAGDDPAKYATLWLLAPLMVAAVATGLTLEDDITGWSLTLGGLLVVLAPRKMGEYWGHIQDRTDHRGGPVTFSMFLLYGYRNLRAAIFTLWMFAPVLAIVESWRNAMVSYTALVLRIALPMFIIRMVAGFGFVYRRIDRFGARFGFPVKSQHYD